jgi:hypothetical protein
VEKRARHLFFFLLLLVAASVTVLVVEQGTSPRRRAAAAAFQQQVGGLGLDPRLEGACSAADGPLPGGACFCPRQGGTLTYSSARESP